MGGNVFFRRQLQRGLREIGSGMVKLILAGLLLAAWLLALSPGAQADNGAVYPWQGLTSDYFWTGNWVPYDHVPKAGDIASFPDTLIDPKTNQPIPCYPIVDINQDLTVGQFAFDDNKLNAYTINVNANLYFDGLGLDRSTSPSVTFNINSGTTTFTGSATDNNVPLVLNGGTLAAGSNNAWGNASITINSGALQAVSGTTPTLSNNIKLNGDVTFSGSSDLTLSGNINLGNEPHTLTVDNTGHTYLTGNINLNDDVTFSGSGDLTISAGIDLGSAVRTLTLDNTCVTTILGDIVGGGIFKAGSGTLVLSGANAFLFGSEIKDGTLVAASDSALGLFSAPVTLNGGTLQAGGNGDRTLANPIYLTDNSCIKGVASNALTLTGNIIPQSDSTYLSVRGDGNVTLGGAISGSNSLIEITNSGILTLSGDNRSGDNPLSGLIYLYNGTLVAASDSALGYSALWLMGGTLQAGGTGPRTLSNSINLGGNYSINGTTNNDLTLSGSIDLGAYHLTVFGDGNVTLAGPVSGSGGLILDSGTLTLSGENTFTGLTNISAGSTLVVAGNSPLGTSNLQLAEGTTLQAGGAGDCTLKNAVILTGNPCIGAVAGHNLTLAGQVSGSGGFTMNSTGTLTLSGANNPYTGITTVNSGTLASGADNAIGQGTTHINTGAKVNLGSHNQTFATLNGGGDLTGTGVMTIGAGDFSGSISGTGGQVVKDTAGTLTLSG
jgi:fibronectin-binding autotransporter adhesin